MLTVDFYTKKDCGLCDKAYNEVLEIGRSHPFRLHVVDIAESADLTARYGNHVPVIVVEQVEVCRHRLDREAFLRRLRAGESSRG